MNKRTKTTKIIAPYNIDEKGNRKALIFEADMTDETNSSFATDIEAVVATKPKSLQEFITRLVEVQKMPKI